MTTTLRTRKPVDSLKLSDLDAFPVWEYATDEEGEDEDQDETWVRPRKSHIIPLDAYSLSVSARFTAANGKEYRGIVDVTTAEGFEVSSAAILAKGRYVFIPEPGYDGAKRDIKQAAKDLGLKLRELLPLKFELLASLKGESTKRGGTYEYRE